MQTAGCAASDIERIAPGELDDEAMN